MASIFKDKGKWRAQFNVDGKRRSKTFDTRREAQRWAGEIDALHQKGMLPSSEAERITLGAALERYNAEITPSKKGADVERHRINKWLRDPLAQKPITKITSFDIARWRDQQVAAGAASSSIRNDLNLLSHLYRIASSEWSMSVGNPVAGVRRPKAAPARDRRLEPGEYERLITAAADDPNPWIGAVLDIALETGMRRGEILAFHRDQIKDGAVHLTEDQTKTSKGRVIPLSGKATAVIQALPASIGGRVFPCDVHTIEHAWRRICDVAGVEDLRLHDCRREFASRAAERGCPRPSSWRSQVTDRRRCCCGMQRSRSNSSGSGSSKAGEHVCNSTPDLNLLLRPRWHTG